MSLSCQIKLFHQFEQYDLPNKHNRYLKIHSLIPSLVSLSVFVMFLYENVFRNRFLYSDSISVFGFCQAKVIHFFHFVFFIQYFRIIIVLFANYHSLPLCKLYFSYIIKIILHFYRLISKHRCSLF